MTYVRNKTTDSSYLSVDRVTQVYEGGGGVRDISISVPKGEMLVLLGPSGCGKTTLLRLIAGLLTAQEGSIYADGKEISFLPPEKRHIGMVFQTWALFPSMSVRQNIEFGLRMHHMRGAERRKRTQEVLELVGLEDLANRRPKSLSGGQQQRIALARAVAIEPSLILLDEPLSSLDQKIRLRLRKDLRDLQLRLGLTGVYVTHDHSEALELGDKIAIMDSGRIVEMGEPLQLFQRPQRRYTAEFLGETNVFDLEMAAQLGGPSPTSAPSKYDSEVTGLAINPDAITLESNETAPVTAVVSSIEYQASGVIHTLNTPEGAHLKGVTSFDNAHSIGDSVGVSLNWRQSFYLY